MREKDPRPVLLCIAGSGCDFREMVEKYQKARGDLPFLIVSPCTFSNANQIRGWTLELYRGLYSEVEIGRAGGPGLIPDVNRRLGWDEAGLLAILQDLKMNHGAARRIYLTGFSGGGLLTYRMIVNHPDLLAAAVPVCPNFNFLNHGYPSRSQPLPPGDRAVPVRILLGEKDPLRRQRYGGDYLPSGPIAVCLVLLLTFAAGYVLWKLTRRVKCVAVWGILGVLLAGLVGVSPWSGIDAQTEAALELLKDLGYTNVERKVLPNRGHEPAPEEVWKVILESSGKL